MNLPITKRLLTAVIAMVITALIGIFVDFLPIRILAWFGFGLLFSGLLLWTLWKVYQAFLWRVGRRLAFSYFLIGVLPIALASVLLAMIAYVVTGFFLGHLYRDAASDLQLELNALAAAHPRPVVADPNATPAGNLGPDQVAYAVYERGARVRGDERAPLRWPDQWLSQSRDDDNDDTEVEPQFALFEDNSLTLVGLAATGEGSGTLAFLTSDAQETLCERGNLWVHLLALDRNSREDERSTLDISFLQLDLTGNFSKLSADEMLEERDRFFSKRAEDEGSWDQSAVDWVEFEAAPSRLSDGERMGTQVLAVLSASPRMISEHLFSGNAALDRNIWLMIFVTGILFMTIYGVAEVLALVMIVGLSRAVNQLYSGTQKVSAGDFSVRIPVRRKDQIGALHRSFNAMASSLETLVSTATQKEILEKELQIAGDLQQSLLPRDLPSGEGVEFVTLFEPSAAIGGDYFDVLRISDSELAVIIADVSGHGLSSGLRMAMLKAALSILIEDEDSPETILGRLDAVVRSSDQDRFFVTATLAKVDFRSGVVEVTNAGHPPTYLLREGGVEEIELPSSPLGGLGNHYAHRQVNLQDGDILVWLSDGLIEAVDPEGEQFGYERVLRAFEGPLTSPDQVRQSLLGAVEEFTKGQRPDDDCTLVVMRYNAPSGTANPRNE